MNKNMERLRRWRVLNPEKHRQLSRDYMRRKRATAEGRAHLKMIADKYRYKTALRGRLPPYPRPEFCEICHRRKRLCLDHDHVDGKFRGWLCASCNRGLGLLGDSEFRVETALRYLRGDKSLLGMI
jgi:hypothetical protein